MLVNRIYVHLPETQLHNHYIYSRVLCDTAFNTKNSVLLKVTVKRVHLYMTEEYGVGTRYCSFNFCIDLNYICCSNILEDSTSTALHVVLNRQLLVWTLIFVPSYEVWFALNDICVPNGIHHIMLHTAVAHVFIPIIWRARSITSHCILMGVCNLTWTSIRAYNKELGKSGLSYTRQCKCCPI